MPVEFKLPELGENIEKGDVARVLVKVGDMVAKDQPVMELETDKATIEVPATVAGKVTEVRVKAGEKAAVGQVVMVVDEAKADAPAAGAAEAPKSEPDVAKTAPEAADNARKAVDAGEETSPRQAAPVVDISRGRQAPAAPSASPARTEAASVPAAPSTRRYARELGVEIAEVPGTGPGGRIGQADVKEHVKTLLAGGGGRRAVASPLPDFSKWGAVDVQPMSNIRRKTAEHLSAG
ncbi:MAG: E3 binding domain-containing protein, partial [Acidobacteria bacterium]|nr:E3 binding domain-containing protein [Acidobacteriota bacterium]